MGSSRRALLIAAASAMLALAPASAPAASPPVGPQASQNSEYVLPELRYLTPSPVVRLAGRITSTGVRVTLLGIRAPSGARVTVRCLGRAAKGCPFRSRRRLVPASRSLRFRALHRRLKAGALLQIYVRRGPTIGKYTSFRVRRGRVPRRTDLCLFPGVTGPLECG